MAADLIELVRVGRLFGGTVSDVVIEVSLIDQSFSTITWARVRYGGIYPKKRLLLLTIPRDTRLRCFHVILSYIGDLKHPSANRI